MIVWGGDYYEAVIEAKLLAISHPINPNGNANISSSRHQ